MKKKKQTKKTQAELRLLYYLSWNQRKLNADCNNSVIIILNIQKQGEKEQVDKQEFPSWGIALPNILFSCDLNLGYLITRCPLINNSHLTITDVIV